MKGATARKHLVENCPKVEQIGAMIGCKSLHLLRRHITNRTQHHAEFSLGSQRRRVSCRLRTRQFRQPEIQNLYPPVARNKNILRLQITEKDTVVMRRRQTPCDL